MPSVWSGWEKKRRAEYLRSVHRWEERRQVGVVAVTHICNDGVGSDWRLNEAGDYSLRRWNQAVASAIGSSDVHG